MSNSETIVAPELLPDQSIAANLFSVAGGGVQVTFSTSGIDGKPHFSYRDPVRTLNFQGDQIRIVTMDDLVRVVSVTIVSTIDSGSTSFSLLLPRVSLSAPFGSVPIRTDGITTRHAFSMLPPLNHGQRDFYTVTAMRGTASQVSF